MTVTVRSFAKINLGLYIGAPRADGFHDLRTIYQTIALHDAIRVTLSRGRGIEILCDDERVPVDESNTCHRIAQIVARELKTRDKIKIEIEKRLPVQGGMGAASSNAVATMFALELAAGKSLEPSARLRIASEVGSDLPQFLVGGTSLGVGRGEEVFPVPDLPVLPLVVVTPPVGVSTPKAFADWDSMMSADENARRSTNPDSKLTALGASDRLVQCGRVLSAWLCGSPNSGAPAQGGSRAGSLLLDLVRTGIENDFEKVVFPQYPELRDIKSALERAGSIYVSLSGSGSSLYGLFRTRSAAVSAAQRLRRQRVEAQATATLTRRQYWKKLVVGS